MPLQYDEVILVGGLNHEHDSEGIDRADMKLPYEQDELIREVTEGKSEYGDCHDGRKSG